MTIALLMGAIFVFPLPGATAATSTAEPIKFGMGGGSHRHVEPHGVPLDYETFWVGPWTLKHGWGGPDAQMQYLRSEGVTPAIHYYYWGDDITPTCVENGCWSDLHGSWKDKAGWQTLAQQLVDHLNKEMQGEEVVIFLETEFNKGGISEYEPFDGYLEAKAKFIKENYPNAIIVLPFGNWNKAAWSNFDRAAAASDMVGIQGMRGSTRDSHSHYRDLFESTVSGGKYVKQLFNKPTMVHDLALSSYPEPEYREYQRAELAEFFNGMDELKGAGVEAIIYRSWYNANMDLANYYGMAERYWGFADKDTGWKPAANVWLDGIKAERANSATPSGDTGDAGPLSASYTLGDVNEWWVDVKVTATNPVSKVEAQVNGGSWTYLAPTSWGTHAKSFYVAKGSDVVFRVTDTYGQTTLSGTYDWLVSDGPAQPAPEPEPTPEPTPSAYDAKFRLGNVNEWWVETYVDAPTAPAQVEAQVDGGTWKALSKKSWGSHAASFYIATGSDVVFRATDASGATATSGRYVWLVSGPHHDTTEPTEPANTAPTAAFTATTNGLTVTLDATGSSDADGDTLTYAWTLGDGMSATGSRKTHTYDAAGSYTVTLTVSDGTAKTTTSKTIVVEEPNRAPKAAFTATLKDLTGTFDASSSSDPDGDTLRYTWTFGDGKTATGATASHTYAKAGTYTVTLTVSDGDLSAKTSKTVTATEPNRAPAASFTATTDGLKVSLDASASSDPDGDALAYTWTLGDGKTATGATASHTYAKAGTYTVTLTVSDGALTGKASKSVSVAAPQPTGYDATFRLGNANEWWVEVYVDAPSAPAKVEAQVDGGTWVQLDKKSWGSHAKSLRVPTGSDVVFRATDASGATDVSGRYVWLVSGPHDEATTQPTTEPTSGPTFAASFSPKHQDNAWWVEVSVDANEPLAKVEACTQGGSCIQLDKTRWGSYAKSFDAGGKQVVFKATSTSGATAESTTYKWG